MSDLCLTPPPPRVTETQLWQVHERNERLNLETMKSSAVQFMDAPQQMPLCFGKDKTRHVDNKDVRVKDLVAKEKEKPVKQSTVRCCCTVAPLPKFHDMERRLAGSASSRSPSAVDESRSRSKSAAAANENDNDGEANGADATGVEEQPEEQEDVRNMASYFPHRSVWCAEQNGTITVRDASSGQLLNTIIDAKEKCIPSAMCHAPGTQVLTESGDFIESMDQLATAKAPVKILDQDFVWVGFNDGSIRLFEAEHHQRVQRGLVKDDEHHFVFELSKQHAGAITGFTTSPLHYQSTSFGIREDESQTQVQDCYQFDEPKEGDYRNLICSASSDSTIVLWDLTKVYVSIAKILRKQKELAEKLAKAASGRKGFNVQMANKSHVSPSAMNRNGPPIYFKPYTFVDEKDNEAAKSFSYCTVVPVRPLAKLKGAVSGIRSVSWISTKVTTEGYTPARNNAASARDIALDDDEEDDIRKRSLRRIQLQTRQDKREEQIVETGLTREEYEEAEAEYHREHGIVDEDKLPPPAVRERRVNILVAGDDEGRLLIWHLDEELSTIKGSHLTAESLRSSSIMTNMNGDIPHQSRSTSIMSQRDYASGVGAQRRQMNDGTASLASFQPSLGGVSIAPGYCRTTEKRIHFTGGVAIAGAAAVVPDVIRVELPTELAIDPNETIPDDEKEYDEQGNEIVPERDMRLPLSFAQSQVYKHLELFVGLTDGSLQFLSCHPIDINSEDEADAMNLLERTMMSPMNGSFVQRGVGGDSDVLGSLEMGNFSVFFQKKVLEYQPEMLNHMWFDKERGHVWVSRGNGSMAIYDTKTLTTICRIEDTITEETIGPYSRAQIEAGVNEYRYATGVDEYYGGGTPIEEMESNGFSGEDSPRANQDGGELAPASSYFQPTPRYEGATTTTVAVVDKNGIVQEVPADGENERPRELQRIRQPASAHFSFVQPTIHDAFMRLVILGGEGKPTEESEGEGGPLSNERGVNVLNSLPDQRQRILDSEIVAANRLLQTREMRDRRRAEKAAARADARHRREIIAIKNNKLEDLRAKGGDLFQIAHILFMRWHKFLQIKKNERLGIKDEVIFETRDELIAGTVAALNKVVTSSEAVWNKQTEQASTMLALCSDKAVMSARFKHWQDTAAEKRQQKFRVEAARKIYMQIRIREAFHAWQEYAELVKTVAASRKETARRQKNFIEGMYNHEQQHRRARFNGWMEFAVSAKQRSQGAKRRQYIAGLLGNSNDKILLHMYFAAWCDDAVAKRAARRDAHYTRIEQEELEPVVKPTQYAYNNILTEKAEAEEKHAAEFEDELEARYEVDATNLFNEELVAVLKAEGTEEDVQSAATTEEAKTRTETISATERPEAEAAAENGLLDNTALQDEIDRLTAQIAELRMGDATQPTEEGDEKPQDEGAESTTSAAGGPSPLLETTLRLEYFAKSSLFNPIYKNPLTQEYEITTTAGPVEEGAEPTPMAALVDAFSKLEELSNKEAIAIARIKTLEVLEEISGFVAAKDAEKLLPAVQRLMLCIDCVNAIPLRNNGVVVSLDLALAFSDENVAKQQDAEDEKAKQKEVQEEDGAKQPATQEEEAGEAPAANAEKEDNEASSKPAETDEAAAASHEPTEQPAEQQQQEDSPPVDDSFSTPMIRTDTETYPEDGSDAASFGTHDSFKRFVAEWATMMKVLDGELVPTPPPEPTAADEEQVVEPASEEEAKKDEDDVPPTTEEEHDASPANPASSDQPPADDGEPKAEASPTTPPAETTEEATAAEQEQPATSPAQDENVATNADESGEAPKDPPAAQEQAEEDTTPAIDTSEGKPVKDLVDQYEQKDDADQQ